MTRSFTDAPVDPSQLHRLVDWAHRGPSAGNSQPLSLVVLTGSETEQYWKATLTAERRAAFPWPDLLSAPVLILPYVEPGRYVRRYAEPDKAHTGLGQAATAWPVPYWWVDGGAAVQNVLLGAAAFGLGACFFGQFDHEEALRKRFGVPDDLRSLGTIAIGHPRDQQRSSQSARRGRRPLEDTVHWGRWDAGTSGDTGR